MIEILNLTKSYALPNGQRKYIVRDLNLTLPLGINVGLLGGNGAGKTTLLRIIGGIDFADKGEIRTHARISPPFGLKGGFSGALSGKENAKFICRIQGDDEAMVRSRVEYIESFAELGTFFRIPLRTYSSGMRARLAFAISMAFDFDYYLIDELVSVGDRSFRRKARAALTEKRGRASTILISHNLRMHRVESDVGLYLKDGMAHYFDDIKDAIDAYEADTGVQDQDGSDIAENESEMQLDREESLE